MIKSYDEALAVLRADQDYPVLKLSPWGFETTDFFCAYEYFVNADDDTVQALLVNKQTAEVLSAHELWRTGLEPFNDFFDDPSLAKAGNWEDEQPPEWIAGGLDLPD